ncbi:MAG TPA: hypothetical protein VHP37_05690 [Burkholderiales bacterium]|jgi:hypothetical protein|nr:hypothetical protein [Burkholderiales bacterium]
MSIVTALHGPTLLVTFAVTNLIMAAAIWLRFLRTARAGLRPWACGLAAQSVAATLLLAPFESEKALLVVAAVVLALGVSTQMLAACSLLHRRAPTWLLITAPVLAIAAFAQPAFAGHSSLLLQPRFAALLLAFHCITTASSLAFVIAARNTDSIFRR